MTSLEGKKAVVTGGSRGIGRAIVERLAREGAEVVFSYASNGDAAAEVEKAVAEDGGQAHAIRADLTEPEAAEELLAAAVEHLGGLDILVNNAAVAFSPAPFAETEVAEFDRVMLGNARAVFVTVRYAARQLEDGGRIINISTLNTIRPVPGSAPYVASKGAVEQLTLVAAQELGARGITVNTVSPGATDTDLLRSTNPAEALAMVAGMTPLGRLGEPADVADVVAFLAGPDARWLTGQNIGAGGGIA